MDKLDLIIQNLSGKSALKFSKGAVVLECFLEPLSGHKVRTGLAIGSQPGNTFVSAVEAKLAQQSSSVSSPTTSEMAWRKT